MPLLLLLPPLLLLLGAAAAGGARAAEVVLTGDGHGCSRAYSNSTFAIHIREAD